MIYDVTDLDVYNRAVKALKLIYNLEKQIPNSHFKLRVQLTSAAEGIPAHLAEGRGERQEGARPDQEGRFVRGGRECSRRSH